LSSVKWAQSQQNIFKAVRSFKTKIQTEGHVGTKSDRAATLNALVVTENVPVVMLKDQAGIKQEDAENLL
jgi:hypothetical protein